jgi:predicted metalloprotease with PDZ domain
LNAEPSSKVASSAAAAGQDRAVPRLCRLKRTKRDDPYGFDFKTLKAEGRHVANNVKVDFPAHCAGLRDNDYILDVNNEAINGMEHDAVVSRISSNPNEVDLLVVADLAGYIARQHDRMLNMSHDEVDLDMTLPMHHVAVNNNQPLGSSNPDNINTVSPGVQQHRVQMIPGVKSLGISLVQGGRVSSIDAGSASDRAGLRAGDKIVEVNGQSVVNKSNKEIAKLIKENEQNLVIGVIPGNSNGGAVADAATTSVQEALGQTVHATLSERPLKQQQQQQRSQSNVDHVRGGEVSLAPEPSSLSSASGKKLGKYPQNTLLFKASFIGEFPRSKTYFMFSH